MKKSQKGFTLVELIVVIAIIGVLAAILVPSMMGYVKKSKLKSANSNAKLVYTTVNNQAADLVVEGKSADVKSSGGNAAGTDGKAVEIKTLSGGSAGVLDKAVYNALKDNGDAAGWACWTVDANGNVTLAQWCSASTVKASDIPGQYPDPITDPDKLKDGSWGVKFAPKS